MFLMVLAATKFAFTEDCNSETWTDGFTFWDMYITLN